MSQRRINACLLLRLSIMLALQSHGGSGIDDITAFLDSLDLKYLNSEEKAAFEAQLRHARKEHAGNLEGLMAAEDAICDKFEEMAHTRMAHEAAAGKKTSAHHLDELGASGRHEHLGAYGKANVPHSTKGKGTGKSKEATAGGAGGSAANTEDEAEEEEEEVSGTTKATAKDKAKDKAKGNLKAKDKAKDKDTPASKGKGETHLTGGKRARGGSVDSDAVGEAAASTEGTAKKKPRASAGTAGSSKRKATAAASGAVKLRATGSASKAH